MAEHGWRKGCRCDDCREAHRVDELKRRRMRGIFPPRVKPLEERFWPKVCKTEDCWLWVASLDSSGYGIIKGGRQQTMRKAHRVAYELCVGPIPDGMQIDHLCGVRNCVNPEHLEPVTHVENMARQRDRRTHCGQGHEFTPDNILWTRVCRTCARENAKARRRAA